MNDNTVFRIRKRFRLTQEEFGIYCGVSKSTISALEEGKHVGDKSLIKVLEALLKLLMTGGE